MADTHPPENTMTSWNVPDLPGQVLTAPAGSRLFLLPDTTLDGVGIYRDDVAGLVKTMRHQGMDSNALATVAACHLVGHDLAGLVAALEQMPPIP
ncbi:hypothetical protein ABT075_21775, partial [Streptomyces sp. NPDC002677]